MKLSWGTDTKPISSGSLQNVSQHHAAIDGASKLLIDKTESLSLADRELVQKATEYAEDLEKQAEQLERYVFLNSIFSKCLYSFDLYCCAPVGLHH